MANAPCSTDLRERAPWPVSTSNREWPGAVRRHGRRAAANPFRRRFERVTVGFWLGGLALGSVGFLVGARMPYEHPVAVVISVAWWTLYCGCFGACLGALVCWLTRSLEALPPPWPVGAGKPPTAAGGEEQITATSKQARQTGTGETPLPTASGAR
jgi:hypothetical protein